MSRRSTSIPATYFETLYAGDPDPWRFAKSEYERDKYAATLAALPRLHYHRGLEAGCSIGILTRELAARCGSLLALDAAASALDQAKAYCAGTTNLDFERAHIPADWPDGTFDLIMLSEIVYYLDANDVAALALRVERSAGAGCDIVLVHWLGETDYPLTGNEAAGLFIAQVSGFARLSHQSKTAQYRLDVLRRTA